MFDLYEEAENKIHHIKKDSKSAKADAKKTFRQLNRDLNCQEALKEVGGFPKKDEVTSFVSRGMSDAGSFLNAILNENKFIEEAIIATWTISKKNIDRILENIDNGKIKKLIFLINDGMLNTNSTKSIYAFLRLEFDKRPNVIYNVANSHAKIQCYDCGGNFYVISGSANWSENPRIENYIIINSENQYKFNKEWISMQMK